MNQDEKACPFCAETIKSAAIVCKHCGRDIPSREEKSSNIKALKNEKMDDMIIKSSLIPLIPTLLFAVVVGAATKEAGYTVTIGALGILYVLGNAIGKKLIITDKQIIFKQGIISNSSIEIQLDKLDSIIVKQGIFGGMFGYGQVSVGGSGIAQTPSPCIDSPKEIREEILKRSEIVKNIK